MSICLTIRRAIVRKNGQRWPHKGLYVEDYPIAATYKRDRQGKLLLLPCRWRTRRLDPTRGWKGTGWTDEQNRRRFAQVCRINGVAA